MNYIKKLEQDKKDQKKLIEKIESELTAFMSYLNSDKFAGFDNNYINATEALTRVHDIRNIILLNTNYY